jgi:hypothetical protein
MRRCAFGRRVDSDVFVGCDVGNDFVPARCPGSQKFLTLATPKKAQVPDVVCYEGENGRRRRGKRRET